MLRFSNFVNNIGLNTVTDTGDKLRGHVSTVIDNLALYHISNRNSRIFEKPLFVYVSSSSDYKITRWMDRETDIRVFSARTVVNRVTDSALIL